MSGLTVRQDKFAREYVKDGNGTRAAQRAGYSGTDATLAVTASRDLLNNPKVSEAVMAHRRRLQERLDISRETLINNVAHIAEQASIEGDFGPAIKATELILKAQGHLVEKQLNMNVDVTQQHLQALQSYTDQRVSEAVDQVREEMRATSARTAVVTDIDETDA